MSGRDEALPAGASRRTGGGEPMDFDDEPATSDADELWPFQMLDELEWVLRELGHDEDELAA